MNVTATKLPGILILEPKVFGDHRGYFLETYNQARYHELGIQESFVQDNLSFSRQGVLRGLHFQNPDPQGKLVYVLQGEVFDVVVDIRQGSPTFGQWLGIYLSGENKKQFYIPPGYAHGFCVTSKEALFAYKCTTLYRPSSEQCIHWNDPAINIQWPIDKPQLSDKDNNAPCLSNFDNERLPRYEP